MKLRKIFMLLASGALALTLCTSCGKTPAASVSEPESEAVSESAAASEEENTDAQSFQAAFDAIAVPDELKDAKRYVVAADYDGDGKEEAFGFYGIPVANEDRYGYPIVFEKFALYYINSEYSVTRVNISSSQNAIGTLVGMTSAKDTDFSSCIFEAEGQKFLHFVVAEPDSEWVSTIMGVYGGYHVASLVGDGFQMEADGRFVSRSEMDGDYEYKLSNGGFTEIGPLEEDTGDKRDADSSARLLKVCQENLSGTYYFLPADYDGDGDLEAYAIWGLFDGSESSDTTFYYIDAAGTFDLGFDAGLLYLSEPIYGHLTNMGSTSQTDQSQALISAGSHKFLVWEMDDGSGYSTSLIFGVKDGKPYASSISGAYRNFHQNADGSYEAEYQGFSDPTVYHYKFTYNAALQDFEVTG